MDRWSWDGWQYYAVILFAVVSGQIARLGYSAQEGKAFTWRSLMVEGTMLPGFAALGGALAKEHDLSIPVCLAVGLAAGWAGFAVFRMMGDALINAIRARVSKGE